jgi:hypothetical protein
MRSSRTCHYARRKICVSSSFPPLPALSAVSVGASFSLCLGVRSLSVASGEAGHLETLGASCLRRGQREGCQVTSLSIDCFEQATGSSSESRRGLTVPCSLQGSNMSSRGRNAREGGPSPRLRHPSPRLTGRGVEFLHFVLLRFAERKGGASSPAVSIGSVGAFSP